MATKTESTKKLKAETIQPKNGVRFLLRQRCQRQWPHTITVVQFQRNPPPKQALTTLSSAFSLGDSISAAATSVGVDGPTASTNPSRSLPFRVGHGFGLHLLDPGYPLIIGGIDIPHSDGDVLLHCVVYAILGALGLPDIGQIVPYSDPKRKGASSVFIKEAVNISLMWILDNFEIFLLFIYLFSAVYFPLNSPLTASLLPTLKE
ncbi:2-C-methyl-D-erythritol 2,4-cyclodiphosphate synthase, chloroplastic [Gossypium arboreum]|uniref:2-C-methyl-D-erythritol 2,4-cyclodiphosphate synthase, chloroplastic n=1 Tax=Gossypium arboreum TaxID=29729 RepID=UPI0008190732|nr:2-C-methyl-D-erythritol 2,4-cyclodiphosphate synthase, chloroplastic [Gossypium arboreum]